MAEHVIEVVTLGKRRKNKTLTLTTLSFSVKASQGVRDAAPVVFYSGTFQGIKQAFHLHSQNPTSVRSCHSCADILWSDPDRRIYLLSQLIFFFSFLFCQVECNLEYIEYESATAFVAFCSFL